MNQDQLKKMKSHPGFIAALDQSGGSTPGALRQYGIKEGAWANEAEMLNVLSSLGLFVLLWALTVLLVPTKHG